MPGIRTEITEITTGLATLGFKSLDAALALAEQPSALKNVEPSIWDRLKDAYHAGGFEKDFASAWENGCIFLQAKSGLRNRRPFQIEWKGPHKNSGYDFIPADLRIDHVYLISCKYSSRLLQNSSPANLFDRLLAGRSGRHGDWYLDVAPDEYNAFYACVREIFSEGRKLPTHLTDLGREGRQFLKSSLKGNEWPELLNDYVDFSHAVAKKSAARWTAGLTTAAKREEMLWRLLRFAPAPYFILGSSQKVPIRIRVHTPWDWRQEFELRSFQISPDFEAKQPQVGWEAIILEKTKKVDSVVKGHVEIRWGHGKFSGNPEAKVYLDTPHSQVPGYASLD